MIVAAILLSGACMVAIGNLYVLEVIETRRRENRDYNIWDWREVASPVVLLALAVAGCVPLLIGPCHRAMRITGLIVGTTCALVALGSFVDALGI